MSTHADKIRDQADKIRPLIDRLGSSDSHEERQRAHSLGITRIHMIVEAEHTAALEEATAQLKRIADALESKP